MLIPQNAQGYSRKRRHNPRSGIVRCTLEQAAVQAILPSPDPVSRRRLAAGPKLYATLTAASGFPAGRGFLFSTYHKTGHMKSPLCPVRCGEVTVQPGLRISCTDCTKTYRQEASGPQRSDWNARMPLQFCRRLNCNAGRGGNIEVRIGLNSCAEGSGYDISAC